MRDSRVVSIVSGGEPARGSPDEGEKLRDIAVDTGLRITTLRTQLSSLLKKVGAERQADLIRVLSSIPVAGR